KKGFDIAEIAHLKPKQFDDYQKSLLDYWEVKNVKDTAFGEGVEKGLQEGKNAEKYAIAKMMLLDNAPVATIARYTQLSIEQIMALKDNSES
ncbi:MAG: hypothetical protein HOP34_16775, partial [Methylococcaceae bacterium]|nr:hypothetical protein [Methylococcaceae bacterium]